MKTKFLILGGGPSGLGFAESLLRRGESDFVLLEMENEVGGLCRTKSIDGAPLDTGGGHFLDIRRPKVCGMVFEYLPQNEWRQYTRDSRIRFSEYEMHHPFEANLWELPTDVQKEFLESIYSAGCNSGKEKPEKFVDWISWKLGDKIAQIYMLPYNRKVFGENLDSLGTYWLDKLPDVSYEEVLKSIRQNRAYGKQPGHAEFYYPIKYGFGELWKRIGTSLGDRLKLNERVCAIDIDAGKVFLEENREIRADYIIFTIPWKNTALKNVPREITDYVNELRHTSIEVTYNSQDLQTDAQWIYFPDESIDYHRILVRKNFYEKAKGYWTETRTERYKGSDGDINFHSEFAYPVNTVDKPRAISEILKYAEKRNVFGLGRWGEHSHYNSDAAVERAMKLAEKILR